MNSKEIKALLSTHHEKLLFASLLWMQVLLLIGAMTLTNNSQSSVQDPQQPAQHTTQQGKPPGDVLWKPPAMAVVYTQILKHIGTSPFQFLPYRVQEKPDGMDETAPAQDPQPGTAAAFPAQVNQENPHLATAQPAPAGLTQGKPATTAAPMHQAPPAPEAGQTRTVLRKNCLYLGEVLEGTVENPNWVEAWSGPADDPTIYQVQKTDRRVLSYRKKDGEGERTPTMRMFLTDDGTLYTTR